MAVQDDYATLFATLERIIEAEPQKIPQLVAVILSGGAFRPLLDKPELLNKVVVMAKNYVAEKKKAAMAANATTPATGAAGEPNRLVAATRNAANKPTPMGAGSSKSVSRPGRVMSVRDAAPPSGPTKA